MSSSKGGRNRLPIAGAIIESAAINFSVRGPFESAEDHFNKLALSLANSFPTCAKCGKATLDVRTQSHFSHGEVAQARLRCLLSSDSMSLPVVYGADSSGHVVTTPVFHGRRCPDGTTVDDDGNVVGSVYTVNTVYTDNTANLGAVSAIGDIHDPYNVSNTPHVAKSSDIPFTVDEAW